MERNIAKLGVTCELWFWRFNPMLYLIGKQYKCHIPYRTVCKFCPTWVIWIRRMVFLRAFGLNLVVRTVVGPVICILFIESIIKVNWYEKRNCYSYIYFYFFGIQEGLSPKRKLQLNNSYIYKKHLYKILFSTFKNKSLCFLDPILVHI
jgi:hypothetical protein